MAERGMIAFRSASDADYQTPGMTEDDFASSLKNAIQDAVNYAEEDLADDRMEAIDAYRAESLDGDAELDETRSRVISRDVHDVVQAIMPSVMRIFFAGRNVVSFRPVGPEDDEYAKQATDFVRVVVLGQDNDGFSICYDAIKDALIKNLGVIKWWWDDDYEIGAGHYTGLTEVELQLLLGDPGVVEIYNQAQNPKDGTWSCTVAYKKPGGCVRIAAVPPEERLIDRSARSIDESTLYGQRQVKSVSDLVAMGFDFDELMEVAGDYDLLDSNEEKIERLDEQTYYDRGISSDPSQRYLEYVEAYVKADLDADGVAERYKVCCAGNSFSILHYADDGELAIELVDEIPFAELCPDPEPHIATGHSVAEQVIDIQTIKSNLLRGTLDSLSRAIFPREEVVHTQVNMDDVLNTEIGAVIRTNAPGMVREIVTSFMGKECLPVLSYLDEVRANRTGITDTTQGLNADALQSSTPTAVNAAVSAGQSRIELIARIFAQKGFTRLFNGIFRAIKSNQDRARTVRMSNNWVPVDPRRWNVGMDATVDVALGRGTDAEKMSMLFVIAQKQEAVLQQMGPFNPLCTLMEYRETLAEIVSLAGYYNPDRFFMPIPQGQIMQQLGQQLQQSQGQLQQLQQQLMGLQFELQKHSAAEDSQKLADAGKKHAETLDKIVDAVQKAASLFVPPDALSDELRASGQGQPGGNGRAPNAQPSA